VKIVSIVEGDGEVQAMPVLLRKFVEFTQAWETVSIERPIRVRRDRFLNRPDELRRTVELAALKAGSGGWILIVLDADDDCAAKLGADLLQMAQAIAPHRKMSVVLMVKEYESIFIACAESLKGTHGFVAGIEHVPDPEQIRDAKGWIRSALSQASYSPTIDQPRLTAVVDLELAMPRSRTLRKLKTEWDKHVVNRT
jgi:Domain of unknown function (DUF4276)